MRAVALAPNSGAYYLLPLCGLSTWQGGRDRVRGVHFPPLTRPRARATTPPAWQTDPARVHRPLPASCPCLALSAPLSPTRHGPAHAQRTARVARAVFGPACSIAAQTAAAMKVAANRAANELVGPRVPRATAHPRPLPLACSSRRDSRGWGDADERRRRRRCRRCRRRSRRRCRRRCQRRRRLRLRPSLAALAAASPPLRRHGPPSPPRSPPPPGPPMTLIPPLKRRPWPPPPP